MKMKTVRFLAGAATLAIAAAAHAQVSNDVVKIGVIRISRGPAPCSR